MSWTITEKIIDEKQKITIINVDAIDGEVKDLINSNIVKICSGKTLRHIDVNSVKIKLYDILSKSDEDKISTISLGQIAEFFIHVFFSREGFKQECFFLNMEEQNGIKKGFDGLYSINGDTWIMESKSGHKSTKGISHKKKINEAYTDLQDKFSGKVKNDPWVNAYNHARNKDIDTEDSIVKELIKFSENFEKNLSNKPDLYNIIPSSTIFNLGEFNEIVDDDIVTDMTQIMSVFTSNKTHVICMNQKSIQVFMNFLKGSDNID